MAIKVICAWCGRHLGGNDGASLVSHGISPLCTARQLAEAGLLDEGSVWDLWTDLGGEGGEA